MFSLPGPSGLGLKLPRSLWVNNRSRLLDLRVRCLALHFFPSASLSLLTERYSLLWVAPGPLSSRASPAFCPPHQLYPRILRHCLSQGHEEGNSQRPTLKSASQPPSASRDAWKRCDSHTVSGASCSLLSCGGDWPWGDGYLLPATELLNTKPCPKQFCCQLMPWPVPTSRPLQLRS